jgi:DNA repair exonuclease SbcCD ATPase subunit
MIPKSLTLIGASGIQDGLGIDRVDFDFTKFQSGLIAFVGDNGVGKTTVMEFLHPYLMLASREGKIQDHFYLRKSVKDFHFQYGDKEYRSNVLIDAKTGKIEAYLYKGIDNINSETAVNPDGKVSSYEAAIEELMGSSDLFFKSIFMCQNYTPFSKLKTSDRKKLFMEILGFQRYAKYEQYAKKQADEVEQAIKMVQTEIETLEADASKIEEKKNILVDAQNELTAINKTIAETQTQQEELQRQRVELESLFDRQEEIQIKIQKFTKLISELRDNKLKTELESEQSLAAWKEETRLLTKEIEKHEGTLGNRATIEKLVENKELTLAELTQRMNNADTVRDRRKKLKEEIESLSNELKAHFTNYEEKGKKLVEEKRTLDDKIKEGNTLISQTDRIADYVKDLQTKREEFKRISAIEIQLNAIVKEELSETEAYNKLMQEWQTEKHELSTEVTKTETDLDNKKKEISREKADITAKLLKAQANADLIKDIPAKQNLPCTPKSCKFCEKAIDDEGCIALFKSDLNYLETDACREEKGIVFLEQELEKEKNRVEFKEAHPPSRTKLNEIAERKAALNFSQNRYDLLKREIEKLEHDGWEDLQRKISGLELVLKEQEANSKEKGDVIANLRIEYIQVSDTVKKKIAERQTELDELPEEINIIDAETEAKTIKDTIDSYKKSIVVAETSLVTKREQLKQLNDTVNNHKLNFKKTIDNINIQIADQTEQQDAHTLLLDPTIDDKLKKVDEDLLAKKNILSEQMSLQSTYQKKIGQFESEVKVCETAQAKANVKKATINAEVQKLSDWRLVEEACSKEGIPALELDASGGQISNIANDLLTRTFDTTFQIRFETIAEKQKGGTKEVFDIKVMKDDKERDIKLLSGGQKVWIEKGIFESIAIYLSRSSDKQYLTSFSDESDGALSPTKKLLYLKMMRESFELGKRYFTILVSQDTAIWSQIQQKIMFSREKGIEYQY